MPRSEEVIRIADLPLWVRILAYAPSLMSGILMVVVSRKVTAVLIAIAAGRPFDIETAKTMRLIGLLLAVGGSLVGAVDSTASVVFSRSEIAYWQTVYSGLGFTGGDWPWALIITGSVVIAASAAFKEGARLQREVDGIV